MAVISDFANNAAALAAGYVRTQTDRGAGAPYDRFKSEYVKPVNGGTTNPGQGDGVCIRAVGTDQSAQATADTNALNALNDQRQHYYGGSAGRASGTNQSPGGRGEVFTVDV